LPKLHAALDLLILIIFGKALLFMEMYSALSFSAP